MRSLIIIITIVMCTWLNSQAQTKDKKVPQKDEVQAVDPAPPGPVQMRQAQGPPQVYTFVEQMPEPTVEISSYIAKHLNYPIEAQKQGVQGRVHVQFVVNEDSTLSDFKVVRGIGAGCDEEAVRMLKEMPRWRPGKQNGRAVKVYYTQPIFFKLQ